LLELGCCSGITIVLFIKHGVRLAIGHAIEGVLRWIP